MGRFEKLASAAGRMRQVFESAKDLVFVAQDRHRRNSLKGLKLSGTKLFGRSESA